jgi:hypothetical protein
MRPALEKAHVHGAGQSAVSGAGVSVAAVKGPFSARVQKSFVALSKSAKLNRPWGIETSNGKE